MKASRLLRTGIPVVLVAGVIFLIAFWGREILQAFFPLFTGIIVSYILLPLAEFFEKQKVSRTLSIFFSIFLSLIVILMIFVLLIPVLADNIKDLTKVLPDLYNSAISSLMNFIRKNTPENMQNGIIRETENFFLNLQQRFVGNLHGFIDILPKTLPVIIDILAGWILSYYILRDREKIIEKFKYIFPKKYREEIVCFMRDIHRIVVKFIQGQILIALIVGFFETTGLYIVGVPYAPLLGFIGGISNIIPYFGPYIGAVPAITVALALSPGKAVLSVLVFVTVQQIDNLFLTPRIIKEKLGLHPVTTIMSVIIGGRLFGFFGLIFTVPLVAMIKIAIKKVYRIISG